MVILISLVALGAGNFPCCKPDEGNRVFFRSAWSHVLTKSYSVIASAVFALDAIMSMYGHVVHLAALKASRLSILRCNQTASRSSISAIETISGIAVMHVYTWRIIRRRHFWRRYDHDSFVSKTIPFKTRGPRNQRTDTKMLHVNSSEPTQTQVGIKIAVQQFSQKNSPIAAIHPLTTSDARRSVIVSLKNQPLNSDQRDRNGLFARNTAQNSASASAHIPDVPLQPSAFVKAVVTVRRIDRVLMGRRLAACSAHPDDLSPSGA